MLGGGCSLQAERVRLRRESPPREQGPSTSPPRNAVCGGQERNSVKERMLQVVGGDPKEGGGGPRYQERRGVLGEN